MRRSSMTLLGMVVVVLAWSGASLIAASCCGETTLADSGAQASKIEVKDHKVTEAEVGQDAVCPVLLTKFKVQLTTLAAEYKGKIYYFCCGGCAPKFKADPEMYVNRAPDTEQK